MFSQSSCRISQGRTFNLHINYMGKNYENQIPIALFIEGHSIHASITDKIARYIKTSFLSDTLSYWCAFALIRGKRCVFALLRYKHWKVLIVKHILITGHIQAITCKSQIITMKYLYLEDPLFLQAFMPMVSNINTNSDISKFQQVCHCLQIFSFQDAS